MKYFWILILFLGFIQIQPAHADNQILDPELAFRIEGSIIQEGVIDIQWKIEDGYYLYKKKIQFKSLTESCTLNNINLPIGKIKNDEFFGEMEIYRNTLSTSLRYSDCTPSQIEVTHQGCSDHGVCFPPIKSHITLTTLASKKIPGELQEGISTINLVAQDTSIQNNMGNDSDVEKLLQQGSFSLILISFFGFGFALAFTPCVFPMIPILSGIIIKQGSDISRSRAAWLSGAYVLGMALTYSLAGVAAGMSGTMLSAALQNAWVLSGFAILFVILALSMFGLFELQLPASLQSRLALISYNRNGSTWGIAIMGALSALIIGPCIAPPLAGALLYIAKTGNAQLGGVALFVMALGMGLPLMLVGIFSREILPKAGNWMNAVTKGFGVALLATALWIISPILPNWFFMLCAAVLLIVVAVFLNAIDSLPMNANGWARLWKGIGVSCLVAGCSLLVGVLSGSRDILQPLSQFQSASAAVKEQPHFERIDSIKELESRIATSERPVLLDFYADWCISCKEMERETFSEPGVGKVLSQFTLLQADVTENNQADKELLKRFNLFGPPAVIFFDKNGNENIKHRVIGFVPSDIFKKTLLSIQN